MEARKPFRIARGAEAAVGAHSMRRSTLSPLRLPDAALIDNGLIDKLGGAREGQAYEGTH